MISTFWNWPSTDQAYIVFGYAYMFYGLFLAFMFVAWFFKRQIYITLWGNYNIHFPQCTLLVLNFASFAFGFVMFEGVAYSMDKTTTDHHILPYISLIVNTIWVILFGSLYTSIWCKKFRSNIKGAF